MFAYVSLLGKHCRSVVVVWVLLKVLLKALVHMCHGNVLLKFDVFLLLDFLFTKQHSIESVLRILLHSCTTVQSKHLRCVAND